MRKMAGALFFLVILGMLVLPAYAQAPPPPAPAPKVTITGLVDFVVTHQRNWSGQGACAPGNAPGCDVTDGGKDRETYSRERGVFTLTGEVGRSRGVWAIELDFTNGAGEGTTTTAHGGTSANADLDTDVAGQVETKWLYVETPVMGPGSLMPFIPVNTVLRSGMQPARGHAYKTGILWSGDFPGVNLETTWSPSVRSTLTFAQIGEALDGIARQTEDFAVLASFEWDVFKGFTLKPTYAYAFYDGGNCGTANLGTEQKGGLNVNTCAAGAQNTNMYRHTIGADARFTRGPLTIQPTLLYQVGEQQVKAGIGGGRVNRDADINAFILDGIIDYRIGPLLLTGRLMYTPGQEAHHDTRDGSRISWYHPINSGFGYLGGYSDIWTGGIDYITSVLVGAGGVTARQSPSYDKYGRRFIALAADYSLTPALTLRGTWNISWTDKDVDTNGTLDSNGITPANRTVNGGPLVRADGDDNYLGTEFNAGFTYRFAPNIAFDMVGAYLFAGSALDHQRVACPATFSAAVDCRVKDADDVYKLSARVRFTF